MSVIEVVAYFEADKRECEHDKQHFYLTVAPRCYKCLFDVIMRQPPTVETCFALVYLEKALKTDAKLHELLRGCHYNEATDSTYLTQILWDYLTCSTENTESCSAIVRVAARILAQVTKFLPSSECFEFARTVLISLSCIPEPCREDVVEAVVETLRENPMLADELQDEILQIRETTPRSLQMFMLTTQILKFSTEVPKVHLGRYTENCVARLLNVREADLRWRCVAASGLELVSEKYPEALEEVPNRALHSLLGRLGSFEMAVVQRLCSTFTSANISPEIVRSKCLDKIFADCIITCQDDLVIETVLDSLIANDRQSELLFGSNINTILYSLLSLLDTRSCNRTLACKVFILMCALLHHRRSYLINELLVAKLLHHSAAKYNDGSDAQLAARRCFISFLSGGHLSKETNFALANSAMSACYSRNHGLPLPGLLRATLTFVEALSSATCQSALEMQSSFFQSLLGEIVPQIADQIRERCRDKTSILTPLLRALVVATEHLRLHQSFWLRTAIGPCIERLWPLLEYERQSSDAQLLLTLYVFVVGEHEEEEDFEVIKTGFRHSFHNGFHPESLYAQLFLCHLDSSENFHAEILARNLGTVSAACRVWSSKLRENLFHNVFRFICPYMHREHQIELHKIYLRFSPNPRETEYLTKLPILMDSLMSAKELRLHARKLLMKACEDRKVQIIEYVLKAHCHWREFVIDRILTHSNVNGSNELLRRLLSANEGIPTIVLGSLVSILDTFLDTGSPFLPRTLPVMLMALETPSEYRFTRTMEQDVKTLLWRLCSQWENSEDMSSMLALLVAFLKSGDGNTRHELLEDIVSGTSFLTRAVDVNFAASLEILLFLPPVTSMEPVIVPSSQLKSLIMSSGVPSRVRRSAILVLGHAVDKKFSAIASDRELPTEELLTMTDELLLNPLFELEALELWSVICKESNDAALATIIKERIRIALISNSVLSCLVTKELLEHFRRTAKCSESIRALLPYLKKWSESFESRP